MMSFQLIELYELAEISLDFESCWIRPINVKLGKEDDLNSNAGPSYIESLQGHISSDENTAHAVLVPSSSPSVSIITKLTSGCRRKGSTSGSLQNVRTRGGRGWDVLKVMKDVLYVMSE